jgi:Uma2 family endonuclease
MARKMPKREVTYADLLDVPPNKVGEILEGELLVSPRPAAPHARAASRLGMLLGPPFDLGNGGPGGWIIVDEPELHLSRDALVPDLAGWRRERMPVMPNTPVFALAPDWVCEVTSPFTTSIDRGAKMRAYGREGVQHFWIVDPQAEALEVYRLTDRGLRLLHLYEGAAPVRAEPFDAIALELGALWAR